MALSFDPTVPKHLSPVKTSSASLTVSLIRAATMEDSHVEDGVAFATSKEVVIRADGATGSSRTATNAVVIPLSNRRGCNRVRAHVAAPEPARNVWSPLLKPFDRRGIEVAFKSTSLNSSYEQRPRKRRFILEGRSIVTLSSLEESAGKCSHRITSRTLKNP